MYMLLVFLFCGFNGFASAASFYLRFPFKIQFLCSGWLHLALKSGLPCWVDMSAFPWLKIVCLALSLNLSDLLPLFQTLKAITTHTHTDTHPRQSSYTNIFHTDIYTFTHKHLYYHLQTVLSHGHRYRQKITPTHRWTHTSIYLFSPFLPHEFLF